MKGAILAAVLLSLAAPPTAAAPAGPPAAAAADATACPAAKGPLSSRGVATGYADRGTGLPVLLSPAGLAYLQVERRPLPRPVAVDAVAWSGAPRWRLPLAPGVPWTALSAVGGRLYLGTGAAGGAALARIDPASGAVRWRRPIAWPAGAPPPVVWGAASGVLILAPSGLDAPVDLDGLGSGPGFVEGVSARSGRPRWRVAGAGEPVLAVPGGVVTARLQAAASGVHLDLAEVAVGGAVRWRYRAALAARPTVADFALAAGTVVWAASGRLGGVAAASGRPRWQVRSDLQAWLSFGGAVVGGNPPWAAAAPLTARSAASGAVLWRSVAALPVLAVGDRLLAVTPATPARPARAWLVDGAGRPLGPPQAAPWAFGGPPYWRFCAPGGAVVLSAASPAQAAFVGR